MGQWNRHDSAIAPMGIMNLTTGSSQYFNVYDEWEGDDTTAEFWQNTRGKIVIVFTSGDTPCYKVGEWNTFCSDQTRRRLFEGDTKMIDHCLLKDLKDKVGEYENKIRVYCYK